MKLSTRNREAIIKTIIISVLISFSCFLTYYFIIILKISIIFTHFFYIPIIISCIWWKRKGLIVPVFLGCFLFLFSILNGMGVFIIDNLLRWLMFMIVGIVTAKLSKLISKTEELSKAYDTILFYKDLFTHDMNNVLQIILSACQLAISELRDIEKSTPIEKKLNLINENVFKGANLVLNVQKLSQLEENNVPIYPTEIFSILKKTCREIKKNYPEKIIKIEIDNQYEEIIVLTNEFLTDVFENLLINAIKHNDCQIIEILIRISRITKNRIKFFKIEFMDNGYGISDDRKERIFQRWYREDEKVPGMGLGLSIVKKIIESYNGKVWVEDNLVEDYIQGSNFILLFQEAT